MTKEAIVIKGGSDDKCQPPKLTKSTKNNKREPKCKLACKYCLHATTPQEFLTINSVGLNHSISSQKMHIKLITYLFASKVYSFLDS